MVKEAKKFSRDVEYPEKTKQGSDSTAQIRLPQELFGKYKGRASFVNGIIYVFHRRWYRQIMNDKVQKFFLAAVVNMCNASVKHVICTGPRKLTVP